MDYAEELFKKLKNFKNITDKAVTPEKAFIKYCKDTLGSVERLHLDFKQKHDRQNGNIEDDDKKNLSKAISGFANSNGGVLIWGIEDKKLQPKPIQDIQKFIAKLLELSSKTTDPLVQNIDGDWLPCDTNVNEGYGFLYIPESQLPPHRVILNLKEIKNHYYIRSADSFHIATYTQLEDMFGRRPKSKLSLYTRTRVINKNGSQYKVQIIIGILNSGRGIAKSPFLAISINRHYKISEHGIDGNMNFGLKEIKSSMIDGKKKYGSSSDVVIHSGIAHEVTAVEGIIEQSPWTEPSPDLNIHYKIAAENIIPIEGEKIISVTDMFEEIKL
jgi:hypothetical protein